MQVRKLQSAKSIVPVRDDRAVLMSHLRDTCAIFNAAFKQQGMPMVSIDWKHLDTQQWFEAISAEETYGPHVEDFLNARARGEFVSGMLHDTQIKTVVEIFKKIYFDPGKSVLCLGAMMCGKTGTANGVQLMGPLFYLLSGTRYYPIQLLPIRKALAKQTSNSNMMSNALYQHLNIKCKLSGDVISLKQYRERAPTVVREFAPHGEITLVNYKHRIMRGKLRDHVHKIIPRNKSEKNKSVFEQLMQRRAKGNVSAVKELCLAAKADDFSVVLVIDEPHWGSHINGVQAHMLSALSDEMQDAEQKHIAITFDATPFSIANAAKFSVVRHRLGDAYCGPNCWGGEALDPTARTRDINLATLADFAKKIAISDFEMINRKAYGSEIAYKKWLATWNKDRKKPLTCSHAQYKQRIVVALRDTLQKMLINPANGRTRGVCLRLLKSNSETKSLIGKLKLDDRIKIIYYMAQDGQLSVEETISNEAKTGPYLIVVTGAARMADLFPQHCTHFLDFTDTISNQIALMQGSYGRACGYADPQFEARWVVMNDRSIGYIRNYIETLGTDMLHPGPQVSMPVGDRRGAPLMNARMERRTAANDPRARRAMEHLQATIVDYIPFDARARNSAGTLTGGDLPSLRRKITQFPDSFMPFWTIFSDSLLRHLETNYKTLLLECGEAPQILRPGQEQFARGGKSIQIAMDTNRPLTHGKVGLRNLQEYLSKPSTSENMQVKGKFSAKTDNTSRYGSTQPQLWLRPDHRSKKWILEVVVLRLFKSARSRAGREGDILGASSDLWFQFHGPDQIEIVKKRDQSREDAAALRRQRKLERESIP